MPRPLRIHLPGGFYHVTLRGNHQQAIFRIEANRHRLNEIVAAALERYGARLHAYCWMTNHLHFLLQAGTDPLGMTMRQIASEYARAFQRKLQTTGHLFERRYHAQIVDVESYLFRLLRYIHMNPVTAGLAKAVDDYRWSSHHVYAGTLTSAWVTTDFALKMFDSRQNEAISAYMRFMECDPRDATYPFDEPGPTPASKPPLEGMPRAGRTLQTDTLTLTKLVAEACRRFVVTAQQLHSDSRDIYLMQVRAWITRRALEGRIANLSQIARELGRDRATLRNAMRRYPKEPE